MFILQIKNNFWLVLLVTFPLLWSLMFYLYREECRTVSRLWATRSAQRQVQNGTRPISETSTSPSTSTATHEQGRVNCRRSAALCCSAQTDTPLSPLHSAPLRAADVSSICHVCLSSLFPILVFATIFSVDGYWVSLMKEQF